jgi:hypothetical protein
MVGHFPQWSVHSLSVCNGDRTARKRIQALEERAVRRDREVAELSLTVSQLKATLEAIRSSLPLPAVPSSPPTL